MLNELVMWWWRQILTLLPAGRHDDAPRDTLVIVPEPDALVLLRRRHGTEIRLGRFARDQAGLAELRRASRARGVPAACVVRLPAAAMLERQLSLPLQAEAGLAQVLRYEMDRVTPFAVEDVAWGWSIEQRDRARGRLLVRLRLVPRASLAELLDDLAASFLRPVAIEAPAPGGMRTVRLDDAPSQARRLRLQRRTRALALACAGLAVIALALPFALQTLAIRQEQARIAALQPGVAEAQALRRRLAGQQAGGNALAAEQAKLGDALGALAAITAILPDGTFLNGLTLAQRKLSLNGQSDDAARLIAAMSADPAIRNPSFAAPVTRAANGRADLFSIHAELAP